MAAVGARAEAGVEYLEAYRRWLKKFALLVSPEDQLPVRLAGYNVTECELPGEVLLWTHQYLSERHCPSSLLTPLCRIILDEVSKAVKKNPNDFGFDPIEAVYISLRLMQAVIARVNAICLRYLDNSQLDTLPPPPTAREYKISSIALKNTRRMMEDRHVVFSNLESVFGIETTEPTSFYAVYDGHGGSAAAAYCCAHLHQYLVESPHFRTDPQRALRDAFLRTDHEFMKKSHEKRANGGSTAVVVLVRGKTLYAGWVGDSQALLAKRLGLMQLVTPHKPSRQDERDRIMAEGGSVLFCWGNWRVNGQLDVSRAIGDTMYKPYVSGEPDLTTVDLDGDEDFVVLACDGLFDFVMDDDITLLVYGDLISNPDDYKAVVKKLVLRAVEEGSEDNISVIVVFLKEPRDIAADNAAQMEATESNIRLDSATILPRMDSDGHTIDLAEPVKIDPTIERILNMEHDDDNMGEDDGVDSDSEDLGPETAVDVADDVDIEIQRQQARDREPPCEPRRETPTPPAHAVCPAPPVPGEGENVAESGEESEDEWNYFKGEEKTEKRSPTPREGELDAQELDTRRPEPGPDHDSAWDSSSGDMNSSPLNPDAPVFIPGGAESPLGGPLLSDDVIAESPRKPVPMDDIELPDSAQFANEATARPAELLDLDNYDQINGHHNVSLEEKTEQLNGNSHHEFGFGLDSGKLQDSLLQDIERVQKDTTDFCNIQVTYAHTGDVDPVSGDIDEELFERLKNKERDPMSMSFYQEKDDDTSDIAGKPQPVDLNAVQPLPDSDEENDTPPNEQNRFGDDKENIFNDHYNDNYTPEPDNDLLAQENPHILEFNAQNLQDNGPIIQANIIETDTPESHKLLFEQIPELPDGKSSDIDFISKDIDDSSERDMDVSSGVHTEERTPSETEGELQEFAASPQPTTDHPLADLVQTEPAETVPDVFDNSKPQELIFGFTNEANSFNLERKDDFFAETQFESDNKSESNENPFLSGSSEKEEASVENLQAFIQESVLNSQSPFPSNHSDLSQHDLDPQIEEHKSEELHNDFESNNFKLPHEESLEEPKVLSEPVVEVEISALEQKFEEQLVLNEFEAPSNPDDFSTVNDILQNCDTQIHLEGDKTDMEPPQEQFTLEESLAAHPTPTPEPTLNLEETEAPMQEPAPIQKVEEPTALEVVAPVSFTPTPEILVPEVTPILATVTPEPEVEIKESRAQEICLPVTSEILPAGEDLNIDLHKEEPTTQPPAIATPPPTPAVEPTAPPLDTLFTSAEPIIPVQETLIAADIPAPPESQVEPEIPALALAGVVTGAAVVAAAATATAAKSKTPASTKKAPATSPTKAATKTLTSKTMTPAPKKTTDKPTTPKTPVSATKGTASATKTAVSKLASTSKTPTTKPAPLSTKPSPASAKTTPTVPARSAPASKPPVSKPPVTKSAPAAPRPTSTKTSTVAPRAASASTTARPAPARTSTTKPTTVAAPKPKPAPAPKADPKPLTNGDVRPPIRRPIPGAVAAPKPAVTAAAPKPAPRPAPTARPAPRPTTARPATTAHTNGATQAKAAAPKPATRAPISGARPALEKQTKDLSNKRLVAKTAPSRTSTVTTKGSANPTAVKIPSKIQAEKALAASAEQAKLAGEAPLTNGAGDAAELPAKAPATPPPQDNALLPDLVA